MKKKVLIISGSPRKNGNTAKLIGWLCEGLQKSGSHISIVQAASLKLKANGCTSCRLCQKKAEYGCVINDGASDVIGKMAAADIIVMATPLYFFSASAQIKVIIDRMFSLYKWDNLADTMQTVLKGKKLALIASAYENAGLKELEKPFILTAQYSAMKYDSLLVANAGVSGDVAHIAGIKEKTIMFGERLVKGK